MASPPVLDRWGRCVTPEMHHARSLDSLPRALRAAFPHVPAVQTLATSILSYPGAQPHESTRGERVSLLPHAVLFTRNVKNTVHFRGKGWLRHMAGPSTREALESLIGAPDAHDLEVQQDFARWQGHLLDMAARRAIGYRERLPPSPAMGAKVTCNLITLQCTALRGDGVRTQGLSAMQLVQFLAQQNCLVKALELVVGDSMFSRSYDETVMQKWYAFADARISNDLARPDCMNHHSTTLLVRYRRCLRSTLLALLHYSRDSVTEFSMRNGANDLEFLRNTGLFYPRADASEPLVFPACQSLHLSTSLEDAINRGDPGLDLLVRSQFPIADVTVDPSLRVATTMPFGHGAGMAQP